MEEASPQNADFNDWLSEKNGRSPWPRVSIKALHLLRQILEPKPPSRLKIDEIVNSTWCEEQMDETEAYSVLAKKRIKLNDCEAFSQPLNSANGEAGTQETINTERDIEFIIPMKLEAQSQPLDKDSIMIAASQSQSQTQDAKNSVRIPRITRLWFSKETNSREKLVKIVSAKLDSFKVKEKLPKRCWRFTQLGSHSYPLEFELSMISTAGEIMLDFRRAKGCSIKFKRTFRDLRRQLAQLELKRPNDLRPFVLKPTENESLKENIPENSDSSRVPT